MSERFCFTFRTVTGERSLFLSQLVSSSGAQGWLFAGESSASGLMKGFFLSLPGFSLGHDLDATLGWTSIDEWSVPQNIIVAAMKAVFWCAEEKVNQPVLLPRRITSEMMRRRGCSQGRERTGQCNTPYATNVIFNSIYSSDHLLACDPDGVLAHIAMSAAHHLS